MKKQSTILLLSLAAIALGLSACNGVGSGGSSPTLSAAVQGGANACSALTPNESCGITLTNNPNGVFGATLDTNPGNATLKQQYPNLFNNPAWNDSFAACTAKFAAQKDGAIDCVMYVQNLGSTTIPAVNVTFNVGSAIESNSIAIGAQ